MREPRPPCDPPGTPVGFDRIAVAGASGSGKTTLARRLADRRGVPYIDMDGLYYGPGWRPRAAFTASALRRLGAGAWVTEWQYDEVAPALVARAQLVIWLDYPARLSITSVVCRTLLRRIHQEALWAGNVEPSPWSFLWRRDHVFRYAWRGVRNTRRSLAAHLPDGAPGPVLWRFTRPRELSRWLAAPDGEVSRAV
ncbi:AAA family ATPase [Actinoplanes sp. NPDC051851]|uniref:AAA family ATPase n=1 Tax=Actinoplanes sp. NPDC051851 TaxID=3154753 RepID=UPI003427FBD9